MTDLDAAFRATTYRIFLPRLGIDLRIAAANRPLAVWLNHEGIDRWAILSAWNPGACARSAADNRQRQAQLEMALLQAEFTTYAAENVADAADWPVEEACFVPGISLEEAVTLAQQFGQLALVHGDAAGIPQLFWIEKGSDGQADRPL